jgi:hypothetical protein
MPLRKVDQAAEAFAKNLDTVLGELEKKVYDVLGKAKSGRDNFDAATLLNSRGEMLQALRDAGYNDLANQHVAKYTGIVDAVKADFDARDLPAVKFGKVTAETFTNIAKADLEMFTAIGTKAVDDMRLELYRHAVSSRPFSDMVNTIRKATVGLDGKGSPLSNYAYTHANTAILDFSKAATREAGIELDAKEWEVVGPDDDVTREECSNALNNPVRTREEWESAGYWGEGKRWNCRHTLYPYFGD